MLVYSSDMAHLDNHALWQVATKALVFRGDELLVLKHPSNKVDFPGGRVDESERNVSWHDALQREIDEELGEDIEITLGETAFVSKRGYVNSQGVWQHIAAIYFVARYERGEVKLSEEHAGYEWINPSALLTDTYTFVSDDERDQVRQYIKTL